MLDGSEGLSSRLVDSISIPRRCEGTRIAPSRLSGPHAVYALDQKRGWSRRYEFTVGAVNATSAGRWARTPPMNAKPASDSP